MRRPNGTFSSCTILRTFDRTSGTVDLATGKFTAKKVETVTEPCDTPLFGDVEPKHGICRSCARGWECEENKFASEAEKARATANWTLFIARTPK